MRNVTRSLGLPAPKALNSPAEMEDFLMNNSGSYIAGVQFNTDTVMQWKAITNILRWEFVFFSLIFVLFFFKFAIRLFRINHQPSYRIHYAFQLNYMELATQTGKQIIYTPRMPLKNLEITI